MRTAQHTDKIYRAVPIPAPDPSRAEELLGQITHSHHRSVNDTDAGLFLSDAQRYAQKSCDCPYQGSFFQLRPTYRKLSQEQLRGYFTWRTKARLGQFENAPIPFALLYAYELINLVGVTSKAQAFNALSSFLEHFRALNHAVSAFLSRSLIDFVLVHDLDPQLLKPILSTREDDNIILKLDEALKRDLSAKEAVQDLFLLLTPYCRSYNFEDSPFFKKNAWTVRRVFCRTFAFLWAERAMNDGVNSIMGSVTQMPYEPFKGSIFYQDAPHPDCRRVLMNGDVYECKEGRWSVGRWFLQKNEKRPGNVLKSVESRLRQKFAFKPALRGGTIPKEWSALIERALVVCEEEERRERIAKLTIDRSKLPAIRDAALLTQNKLIVDEEQETIDQVVQPRPNPTEAKETSVPLSPRPSLTPAERDFLHLLLLKPTGQNQSCQGVSLDLLADSINAKLFDTFCDTVIALEDDHFSIIEDYRKGVEDLLR